jgi:hypothetical protein
MFRLSQGARSMTLRLIPIILAVIGFLLTYVLRQGTSGIPDGLALAPATSSPQRTDESQYRPQADRPAPFEQPQPGVARPEGGGILPPVTPAAEATADSASPADPASEISLPASPTEVPVVFTIQQAADQSESRAILQNQSSESLHINVIAVNPATGNQSEVQVVLAARRKANLTTAGLMVERGDEIRIRSAPYRDQVFKLE